MNKRILVIGSSGGIARRVIPILRLADPLTTIDGIDLYDLPESGVDTFLSFDLLSLASSGTDSIGQLAGFLNRADLVIVLAAAVHDPSIADTQFNALNVTAPTVLYELYRTTRGAQGHFVFISTIAVYGNTFHDADEQSPMRPTTPYARSKADAERLLRELAGQDDAPLLTIIRPATMINRFDRGNLPRLIRFVQKRRVFFTTPQGIEKSFVDVEDIGQLIKSTVSRSANRITVYNAAARAVDLTEILALVSQVTNPFVKLPIPKQVLSRLVPTLTNSVSVCAEKAERELGISFNTFRAAFLREFADLEFLQQ